MELVVDVVNMLVIVMSGWRHVLGDSVCASTSYHVIHFVAHVFGRLSCNANFNLVAFLGYTVYLEEKLNFKK